MHFLITNSVTGAINKYWREGLSTSLLPEVNKKSPQVMLIWLFSWQMNMTIQYPILKKIVMASCLSKNKVPRDYQSVLSGTIIGHSWTHPLNFISLSVLPSTRSFRRDTWTDSQDTLMPRERETKSSYFSIPSKTGLLPGGQSDKSNQLFNYHFN